MKRDDLKKVLSEFIEDETNIKSVIDWVMNENGHDINKHKTTIDELNEQIKTTKEEMDKLNESVKSVDSLEDAKKNLENQLKDWSVKYAELETKHKTEREDRLITDKLKESGCKDIDFALYKIGRDNFVFNDTGDLIGFDDTIKEFKDNHATFFEKLPEIVNNPNVQPDNNLNNLDAEFESACKNLGW